MDQSNTQTDHCTQLQHALSPCSFCGQAIKGEVHAPNAFGGLFCAGCCPCCVNNPDGGSKT